MGEDPNVRRTRRPSDITGDENLLLLLPSPGDETLFAGLIAALCAGGRPPFVAILGDGSPEGTAAEAHRAERASRAALERLGLPSERLLFVGLPQGRLPAPETELFAPLRAAMTLLSWRKDCNVIGTHAGGPARDDRRAARDLAGAIVQDQGLALVVRVDSGSGWLLESGDEPFSCYEKQDPQSADPA